MKKTATCYNHRDRRTTVATCATCQRIACEHRIVKRTVDALLAAGFALTTDADVEPPTTKRAAILARLMEVDDEYVYVHRVGAKFDALGCGWVRFVYGNDGYDVISDYTMNLEKALAPVTAYALTQE